MDFLPLTEKAGWGVEKGREREREREREKA